MAAGLQGWSTSTTMTVPSYQRNGTTFTVVATTSTGKTAQRSFTATAPGTNPTPTPTATPTPTPTASGAFDINLSYNAATGQVTASPVNAAGTVEYMAVGLQSWSTNNVMTVPDYQRDGTQFTVMARLQNNASVTVQKSFTANAPGTNPTPTATGTPTATATPTPTATENPSTNPPTGSGSSIIYIAKSSNILDLIDEWRDGKARLKNRANPSGRIWYWINGRNPSNSLSGEYQWLPGDEVQLYCAIADTPDPWQSHFDPRACATVVFIAPDNAL